MSEEDNCIVSHHMTQKTMEAFIQNARDNNASDNMIRRFSGTVRTIYDFLPEDKLLTRERLLEWRKGMELQGYASFTILNYVKYINKYLDFVGCSEIRFNRGKPKDITGMYFGYLKAIRPTGKKHRKDTVWLFECKCGNTVELPATRVLVRNTMSCGCLKGAHFKTTNQYIDGTSLRQSLTEKRESTRAISGYTGVTPKRDKWQAYITYKGVHYSLGSYCNIEDAVKARAKAKEIVMADAEGLSDFYAEFEKTLPKIPSKRTEPKKEFKGSEWVINDAPASAATRSDNTSGCTGVVFRRNRWEAKICYRGNRYYLGTFVEKDDAIAQRRQAEVDLKKDAEQFEKIYKERYRYHNIRKD